MTIGLIVVPEDGGSAALPLFDADVLDAQLRAMARTGVARTVVLDPGGVAAVGRDLPAGPEILFARTPTDIPVSEAAVMLLLTDGVIPEAALIERLSDSMEPRLFVLENVPAAEEFELLDAGNRWAGIAVLPTTLVDTLGDLPGDWDTGSALCRLAVQQDLVREKVSADHVDLIRSAEDANFHEMSRLSADDSGSIGDRYVVRPLAQRLAATIWRRPHGMTAARAAGPFLGACALLAAGFGWVTLTFVALLGALIASRLLGFLHTARGGVARAPERWATLAAAAVAIVLVAITASPEATVVAHATFSVILLLAVATAEAQPPDRAAPAWLRIDRFVVVGFLLFGAALGQYWIALYLAAVAVVGATGWMVRTRSISVDSRHG